MILFRQLDRGIRQRTSALLAAVEMTGHVLKPGTQLRARIAGMLCRELVPGRARLFSQAPQVRCNQLVLRGEVPVQGHFVGSSRFGDGFDPNCPDPMAIKQVGRDRENAFPRRNSLGPSDSWGPNSAFHWRLPLT